MPLTQPEIDFLDQWLHEYTFPKRGPAIEALAGFGFRNQFDYCWLLESYMILRQSEGDEEATLFGRPGAVLPPLPWKDAEEVRERNRQLAPEIEAWREAHRKKVAV